MWSSKPLTRWSSRWMNPTNQAITYPHVSLGRRTNGRKDFGHLDLCLSALVGFVWSTPHFAITERRHKEREFGFRCCMRWLIYWEQGARRAWPILINGPAADHSFNVELERDGDRIGSARRRRGRRQGLVNKTMCA